MIDHTPGYAPRRSFSPLTVKEIRAAQTDLPTLRQKYDLGEHEARILVYAGENFIDQFGRVRE